LNNNTWWPWSGLEDREHVGNKFQPYHEEVVVQKKWEMEVGKIAAEKRKEEAVGDCKSKQQNGRTD
jgi:hypothetical protein